MDFKSLLNWVGAIVFVLIFFVFAAIWVGFHKGEQSQFKPGMGTGGEGANCSVLFPAGAGPDEEIAKAIDQYIAQNGPTSPLKGTGIVFAQSGRASNINPAVMISIARMESSFGVNIPDATYNPFGRKATESQPYVEVGGSKWYKFNSWEEAIIAQGEFLQQNYVIKRGADTIGKMMNIYCPKADNCQTDQYIENMAKWINEMAALANGALGIGCSSSMAEGCGLEDVDLDNINLISGVPKLMQGARLEFDYLAREFRQKNGLKLPITSMYRTREQQVALCGTIQVDGRCSNPNANLPGTSMHEAGLAFDTQLKKSSAPQGLSAEEWNLLREIGYKYHWELSSTSGGQYGARESWHFDYTGFNDKFWYGEPKIANAIDAANNCRN